MDGRVRFVFPQGVASMLMVEITLKGVAGKGGSKRVAPRNFKMQFKQRE